MAKEKKTSTGTAKKVEARRNNKKVSDDKVLKTKMERKIKQKKKKRSTVVPGISGDESSDDEGLGGAMVEVVDDGDVSCSCAFLDLDCARGTDFFGFFYC